jgi:putative heme iron utilization protein
MPAIDWCAVSQAPSPCRRLAASSRFGALATLAREPAGWPFPSLVAVAFDERGQPFFLLSRLAEHTKNLEASACASLLVSEPPEGKLAAWDPLAQARMTLVGRCDQVPQYEIEGSRARFLAAHPQAAAYASFADFAFWRLDVAHVRWVGGFGRMEWLSGEAYAAEVARP